MRNDTRHVIAERTFSAPVEEGLSCCWIRIDSDRCRRISNQWSWKFYETTDNRTLGICCSRTMIHTKGCLVIAGIRDQPYLARIWILATRLTQMKDQLTKAVRSFQLHMVAATMIRLRWNEDNKSLLLEMCLLVVADRFETMSLSSKTFRWLVGFLKMRHHGRRVTPMDLRFISPGVSVTSIEWTGSWRWGKIRKTTRNARKGEKLMLLRVTVGRSGWVNYS